MNSPAEKRLVKDLQKLNSEQEEGINASPLEGDLFKWTAFIEGPEKTIWEGGLFELELEFPVEYPAKPPRIRFLTKMFHPNIYNDGKICLDSNPSIIKYCKISGVQSMMYGPFWPPYDLYWQIRTPILPPTEMQLWFITQTSSSMKEESNKSWIWA